MAMPSVSTKIAILLSFSVAAFGFAAGCGGDGLGECPADSNGQQTSGANVLQNQCASCHGPTYANGNPADGLDFTDAAVVKAQAESMYAEAEEGSMPPTGKLSAENIEALRVYLACTTQ